MVVVWWPRFLWLAICLNVFFFAISNVTMVNGVWVLGIFLKEIVPYYSKYGGEKEGIVESGDKLKYGESEAGWFLRRS